MALTVGWVVCMGYVITDLSGTCWIFCWGPWVGRNFTNLSIINTVSHPSLIRYWARGLASFPQGVSRFEEVRKRRGPGEGIMPGTHEEETHERGPSLPAVPTA